MLDVVVVAVVDSIVVVSVVVTVVVVVVVVVVNLVVVITLVVVVAVVFSACVLGVESVVGPPGVQPSCLEQHPLWQSIHVLLTVPSLQMIFALTVVVKEQTKTKQIINIIFFILTILNTSCYMIYLL